MREPLIIEIPGTFDPCLSGNATRRTHWGKRGRANEDLKNRTHYAATEAVGDPNNPYLCFQCDPWPLVISYTIGWEFKRRGLDDDNLLTAMKGVRDQIASVLGMDDKHFVTGTVTQERDHRKVGYIRVTVVSSAWSEEVAA